MMMRNMGSARHLTVLAGDNRELHKEAFGRMVCRAPYSNDSEEEL
jgi:hypothetical protein